MLGTGAGNQTAGSACGDANRKPEGTAVNTTFGTRSTLHNHGCASLGGQITHGSVLSSAIFRFLAPATCAAHRLEEE